MEIIKKNKKIIIILLGILLCMFLICHFNMMAPDEYNYSNIASGEERVTSIGDIITTQKALFLGWTGRIPAHTLIQLFLLIGGPVFDIANAFVFIAFIILILKIGYGKVNVTGIASILLMVLLVGSVFWSKFIWLSGSVNYLWTSVGMLIVIYYLYNIVIKDKKMKVYETIFLLIISFLAGWSQENTAFVLGSFIVVLFLSNLKRIFQLDTKRKIIIMLSATLVLLGSLILLLAPGNYVRLGDGERMISFQGILSNSDVWIKLISIYVISVIISFFVTKKNNKKEILQQIVCYIIPVIIALVPMLIIPVFPERSMLPYETLVYIAIVTNICQILHELYHKKEVGYRVISTCITYLILIISLGYLVYLTYFAGKYIKPYETKLFNTIKQAKQDQQSDIVIQPFEKLEQAKKMQVNLEMFPDILTNQCASYYIARYYGINSVIAVPEGMTCIEVELYELDNNKDYHIVDRDSGDIIASRIVDLNYGFYAKNITNKASFCIKTEDISHVTLTIPTEKIKSIKLKSNENIKVVESLI